LDSPYTTHFEISFEGRMMLEFKHPRNKRTSTSGGLNRDGRTRAWIADEHCK